MTVSRTRSLALLSATLLLIVSVACRPRPEVGARAAITRAPNSGSPAVKGPTVVPILYQYSDWGTDFAAEHPEWGPVGSIEWAPWEAVNPAPGVYDWSAFDQYLAKESKLRVQLSTGEVISKPVQIEVWAHLSSYEGWDGLFYDATPGWVYDKIEAEGGGKRPQINGRKVGHAILGCNRPASLPMYESPTWQQAYWDLVRALGARYNDDPQVTSVVISTGLDGETQPAKRVGECQVDKDAAQQVRGLVDTFQAFVLETMRVYRQAFPAKALFVNNCPGGPNIRRETMHLAAALDPPVGLKNSGLLPDAQGHYGIGNVVGAWDPERIYSDTLPIWIESAHGIGPKDNYYWSLLAALHYHPVAIDLHPPYFEQSDPAWLQFAQRHLGLTVANTPDVWTVLRDLEVQPITWGKDGQTGKPGDWQFWLYRLELPGQKTVVLKRQDLPAAAQDAVGSRQARRTDQARGQKVMSFQVDERVWFAGRQPQGLRVELTFLNQGTDTLGIEYMDGAGEMRQRTLQKGPLLGPVDQWVTQTLALEDAVLDHGLPGGADLRLNCNGDGDETVHRLVVAPLMPREQRK